MEAKTFCSSKKCGFGGGQDDDGTKAIPTDFHCGFHVYNRQQE